MKRQFKQLIIFLLVSVMTLQFSVIGRAEGEKLLSLKYVKGTDEEKGFFVIVDAKAPGVIVDGKLVITYESSKLHYVKTEAGEAWGDSDNIILVENAMEDGKLVLTFTGIDEVDVGSIFKIKFEILNGGNTNVRIDKDKSSITGAETWDLGAEITLDLKDDTVDPNPDVPTDPVDPIDPPGPVYPKPDPRPNPKPEVKPEPKPEPKPESKPEVKPETKPSKELKFIDVESGDYFKDSVEYVVEKGYMNGISDYEFVPHTSADRAMIITILWRMAGHNHSEKRNHFTDVSSNSYYSSAVNWAFEKGIVKGIDNNIFAPTLKLTREQLVTLFYRYAKYMGYDTKVTGDLSRFKDINKLGDYAVEAMTWAVGNGIVTGTDETSLNPQGTADRAQLATIITRFSKIFIK